MTAAAAGEVVIEGNKRTCNRRLTSFQVDLVAILVYYVRIESLEFRLWLERVAIIYWQNIGKDGLCHDTWRKNMQTAYRRRAFAGIENTDAKNGFHSDRNPSYTNMARPHYEYKSKKTIKGLPLVHVNTGLGLYRARGIIAIGNIAEGVVAIGFFDWTFQYGRIDDRSV